MSRGVATKLMIFHLYLLLCVKWSVRDMMCARKKCFGCFTMHNYLVTGSQFDVINIYSISSSSLCLTRPIRDRSFTIGKGEGGGMRLA